MLGQPQMGQSHFVPLDFGRAFEHLSLVKDNDLAGCLIISVIKEEYFEMCRPSHQSLVIKLLGSNLGYQGIR